jgi:hypothetical protein
MQTNDFDHIWDLLQIKLRPQTVIRNWTALKGYLGDTMTIVAVNADSIEVNAPKAKNILVVPITDFETLWEVWPQYKNHRVQRQEIRDMTFYSKYIISILRWLETDNG